MSNISSPRWCWPNSIQFTVRCNQNIQYDSFTGNNIYLMKVNNNNYRIGLFSLQFICQNRSTSYTRPLWPQQFVCFIHIYQAKSWILRISLNAINGNNWKNVNNHWKLTTCTRMLNHALFKTTDNIDNPIHLLSYNDNAFILYSIACVREKPLQCKS